MDFDAVKKSLERLHIMLDGCERCGFSEIERDAMLEELRSIYSVVKFAAAESCSEGASADCAAAPAVTTPVETVPVVACPTAETDAEQGDEVQAEEQLQEQSAAQQESDAGVVDATLGDAVAAEPGTPSAEKPEDNRRESVVQSLFGEGEIAVSQRRRMIVRSLYDDVLPQQKSYGAVAGEQAERSDDVVPEPETVVPVSEAVAPEPEQEAVAPEFEPEAGEPASDAFSRLAERIEFSVGEAFSAGYSDSPAGESASGHDAESGEYRSAGVTMEDITLAEDADIQPEETAQADMEEDAAATPQEAGASATDGQTSPEMPSPVVAEPSEEHQHVRHAEKADAVLGEVINTEVITVADTITAPGNLASEVVLGNGMLMLEDAIGVNDRFLLIRDLFDGDSDAYSRTVAKLDGFDNLNDCMLHIVENYDWNPHSEGAKLLISLIERKYGTRS